MYVAFYNRVFDNAVKQSEMKWEEFVEYIAEEGFQTAEEKDEVPLFSFTRYLTPGETNDTVMDDDIVCPRRTKDNQVEIYAFIIDWESRNYSIEQFSKDFAEYEWLAWSSYKHRDAEKGIDYDRFRAVFPLSEPIPAYLMSEASSIDEDEETLLESIKQKFPHCDTTCFQPNRCHYFPGSPHRTEGDRWMEYNCGDDIRIMDPMEFELTHGLREKLPEYKPADYDNAVLGLETGRILWNTFDIVAWARHEGLYQRSCGSGKHDILCPNCSQHSDRVEQGCVIWEGSAESLPGMHCVHFSCVDSFAAEGSGLKWLFSYYRDLHGDDYFRQFCLVEPLKMKIDVIKERMRERSMRRMNEQQQMNVLENEPPQDEEDIEFEEVFDDSELNSEQSKTDEDEHPRPSTIPWNYDPTPDYTQQLEEGESLPEERIWLPKNVVHPLNLARYMPNLELNEKDMMLSLKERKFKFLARKCLKVDKAFIVHRYDGKWQSVQTVSDAKALLMREWGDGKGSGKFNISTKSINEFFSGFHYSVLSQKIYVPGGPSFIDYRGNRCINTYEQRQIPAQFRNWDCEGVQMVVRMIDRNLLGNSEREFEEVLEDIFSGDPFSGGGNKTSTRWFFQWLASQWQRPGDTLPLVVWFIGQQQGTGKGTLVHVLRNLLGSKNVNEANSNTISEGKWTSFLSGCTVVVGDEIKMSNGREMNTFVKRVVSNPIISVSEKYVSDYSVPATYNMLMTTNNKKPIMIEEDDRRNVFFKTTMRAECKELVDDMWARERVDDDFWIKVASGLAQLLSWVKIDDGFLRKAFHTALKDEMIGFGRDPVYQWLASDERKATWCVGDFKSTTKLHSLYIDAGYSGDRNYFRTKMSDAEDRGWVKKDKKRVDVSTKFGDPVKGVKSKNPQHGYTLLEDVE